LGVRGSSRLTQAGLRPGPPPAPSMPPAACNLPAVAIVGSRLHAHRPWDGRAIGGGGELRRIDGRTQRGGGSSVRWTLRLSWPSSSSSSSGVRPAQIRARLSPRGPSTRTPLYAVAETRTLIVPPRGGPSRCRFATVRANGTSPGAGPCRSSGYLPRWTVIALIFVAMDGCKLARATWPTTGSGLLLALSTKLHHSQEDHERAHGVSGLTR